MPDFAETVLDLIETSGMTIKEVAEKAGVPYQNLRRWVKGERGKPGGRTVRSYDLRRAEAIHIAITGKPYTGGAS